MPVTSWNDAEDVALQGLRSRTQVIYLRGLRRHMDYGTGIVGIARAVSYQGLSEVCHHMADLGSTREETRMTKHAVRAAIAELERAGLVVPQAGKDQRRLVFFLPLADRDRSVQKRSRIGTAHQEPHDEQHQEPHHEPHIENDRSSTLCEDGAAHGTARRSEQGTAQEPHTMSRTHPVSGKEKILSAAANSETDRARDDESAAPRGELMSVLGALGWPARFLWAPGVVQMVRRWEREGAEAQDVQQAAQLATARLGKRPNTPTYLAEMVLEAKEARVNPPTPRVKHPRTDDEWMAYGKQVGVAARLGESMAAYVSRLRAEFDKRAVGA